MKRRTALQLIGGGLAALAWRRGLASVAAQRTTDYFVIVHAEGGWDVTLWSDPRNERKGLVEPASTDNTDPGAVKHWRATRLAGATATFEILTPPGSSMRLGPAIGDLFDLHDRLTIINGIAMNTVSHDDGTIYSATGRHRVGGIVPQASIDVLIANELGTSQLMPDVSIKFPSAFVGDRLDRRAIPLRAATIEAITKCLTRSDAYLDADDRGAISALLGEEADLLAKDSAYAESYEQLATQHAALPRLVSGEFTTAFSPAQLEKTYPTLKGPTGVRAAFALEAIRRDVVRCVAFGIGGLDTHNSNYRQHAHTLQELFGVIAALVKLADTTPHPTLTGRKLADHLHILVLSEFCRTPMININGGRDHYPNNSALVISPRFKSGRTFGKTDLEQVLPLPFGTFTDGERALTPSDVLATFLGAFAIDPRRYLRDGEVVKALLA